MTDDKVREMFDRLQSEFLDVPDGEYWCPKCEAYNLATVISDVNENKTQLLGCTACKFKTEAKPTNLASKTEDGDA